MRGSCPGPRRVGVVVGRWGDLRTYSTRSDFPRIGWLGFPKATAVPAFHDPSTALPQLFAGQDFLSLMPLLPLREHRLFLKKSPRRCVRTTLSSSVKMPLKTS